jgi:hypothetical protein
MEHSLCAPNAKGLCIPATLMGSTSRQPPIRGPVNDDPVTALLKTMPPLPVDQDRFRTQTPISMTVHSTVLNFPHHAKTLVNLRSAFQRRSIQKSVDN